MYVKIISLLILSLFLLILYACNVENNPPLFRDLKETGKLVMMTISLL